MPQELRVSDKSTTKIGGCFYFCHRGNSMNPTLCELDLLEVRPYSERPIRAGDIIVFHSPRGKKIIAHRVSALTPQGFCTRGDASNHDDPWRIKKDIVIGRVEAVWRNQERLEISGGITGRLRSYRTQLIDRNVTRIIRLTRRVISESGL
jgi:hypothetical protein